MTQKKLPLVIECDEEGTIYTLKVAFKEGDYVLSYKLQNYKKRGFAKELARSVADSLEKAEEKMWKELEKAGVEHRGDELGESIDTTGVAPDVECARIRVKAEEDRKTMILQHKLQEELLQHAESKQGGDMQVLEAGLAAAQNVVNVVGEEKRYYPKLKKWFTKKEFVDGWIKGHPVFFETEKKWEELPEMEVSEEDWQHICEVRKAVEDSPHKAEVIKPSYIYNLNFYEVNSFDGLRKVGNSGLSIYFVKGSKDDESVLRQPGVLSEEVLDMVKKNLEFDEAEVPNEFTKRAITHIKEAICQLVARKLDRQKRGVLGTRKL